MTATVATVKDEAYYDQEETKQVKTKKGRKDVENYYSEEGMSLGFFYGLGASDLGLLNEDTKKGDLRKFMMGVQPRTGEQLFKFRKSKHHFTDICFSAPKDFSLVAELDEGNREKYEALHNRAVKRALDALQPKLYRRINSKNDKEFGMRPVHAIFNHKTSRPVDDNRPDMQWHAHGVTSKMALTADGDWKTIDNYPVFNNQMLAGAIYRADLANGLREFGFEIEPYKEATSWTADGVAIESVHAFKIVGISEEQRNAFSERNKQIVARAKPGATAIDRYNIAQKIKRSKVQWDKDELKQIWISDAKAVGLTAEKINSLKTFKQDSIVDHYKISEEIIRKSITRGKLYESKLRLRLAESEQITGINADKHFEYLEQSGMIKRIKGFEFSTTVDLTKTQAKQKMWKVRAKANKPQAMKEVKQFMETIGQKPTPKPAVENKPAIKPSKSKKKVAKNISSMRAASSNQGTILSLGLTLAQLTAKLFDVTISQEEKHRIQEEIRKIQQQIADLKKAELNKGQKNKPK